MNSIIRHIAVAASSGLFALITVPLAIELLSALSLGDDSPVLSFTLMAAGVSTILWFILSLILKNPRLQKWLILGFASPLLGIPIFYIALGAQSSASLSESLFFGILATGFLSWIFIPLGILNGVLSHFVTISVNRSNA